MRRLYRPVGIKEWELIEQAKFKAFPPRLDWQPIFYPVLNHAYAEQIARDWNTKDAASGYIGLVSAFDMDSVYLAQFEEHVVGSSQHRELWIPAEELENFNAYIIGEIRLMAVFYGEKYMGNRDFEIERH
jgi:hypothetical protein